MTTQIKITQLTDIGNSLNQNTLVPVVNMSGTPTTQKANLQIVGNLILNNAGNGFPSANSSIYSQSVTNAAQPNITSVGTLTSLTVAGNVNLGGVGNVKILGGSIGQVLTTDGAGNLSWASDGTSYSNSNVASYLPTYTGNISGDYASFTHDVAANVIDANYLYGDGSNISNISFATNSNTANIANTANVALSVAGANVTGVVANAEFSNRVYVEPVNDNFSYHVVLSTGPDDFTLHNDIDDGFQYNPADGILTVTRVDATYFVGNLAFAHGLPAANVTGLGNITAVNFNGNGSQVLAGNGAWVAQASGGGLPLANGSSNLNIATANGNVTITANGTTTWSFATDGNLTTSSNLVIGPAPGGNGSSLLQYDAPLQFVGEGPNSLVVMGWAANTTGPEDIAVIGFNSPYTNGAANVVVATGNNSTTVHYWNFDNTGNVTIPGAIIGDTPNNDGYLNWVGNSSGDGNGYTTLQLIPDSTLTGGDQYIILDPTAPGHIHLRAGGTIDNSFASLYLGGEQSYFMVPSGSSPSVYASAGGNTWTFGNDGVLAVPGNINFSGDPSAAPSLNDFFSVTSAVDFSIIADSTNTDKTWKFDSAGNLTLPGNTVAINFANGSAAFANLVQWTTAPVANTSTGTAGQAAYDSGGNLYVCVATDTWAKFTGTTSW